MRTAPAASHDRDTRTSTDGARRRARVLVIDDEPQIRRFLDISLRAQGYRGRRWRRPATGGLERWPRTAPTWSSSTWACPTATATRCCASCAQWSQVPVIVLTVRADEAEKVAALDAGANDYVTKPFGVQELMARVRALLRAHAAPAMPRRCSTTATCASTWRGAKCSLDGEPVVLARKEYALLALLVQHAGRVVTQPQLLRELWGPTPRARHAHRSLRENRFCAARARSHRHAGSCRCCVGRSS